MQIEPGSPSSRRVPHCCVHFDIDGVGRFELSEAHQGLRRKRRKCVIELMFTAFVGASRSLRLAR